SGSSPGSLARTWRRSGFRDRTDALEQDCQRTTTQRLAPVVRHRLLAQGAEQRDQLLRQQIVADGPRCLGALEQHLYTGTETAEGVADMDTSPGLGQFGEHGP